ncbi:MAG: lysophospholipid acyltransferase family protein [bacterium]
MRVSWPASVRNVVGPVLRRAYRVRVTGAHRVPRSGGVLLVANHDGLVDATVLAVCGPRPVRVVTEAGALGETWARLASVTGRIVVQEGAPQPALRAAVAAARGGDAVGMFPEGALPESLATGLRPTGPGAAYVQARSGVPVVCVALLGTHGVRPTDPPSPGAEIDVVFGQAFLPEPPADPFRASALQDLAERIRQRLADHLEEASARTGRTDVPRVEAPGDNGAS